MANFLESSKIKMYPSSFREHTIDPESYLNIESNLTQARKLSEDATLNSYVYEEVDSDNTYLIIYLGGYYFRALKKDVQALNLSPTWAYIKILEDVAYYDDTNTFKNKRIDNIATSGSKLDRNDVFEGIKFIQSEPTSSTYKIQVLDTSGEIPSSSRLKLKTSEIKDVTSGLPISEEFSTKNLNITTIISDEDIGVKINDQGKFEVNDLSVNDPSIGSDRASSFIDSISQTKDGRIVPTKKQITIATNSQLGVVKSTYTSTSLPTIQGLTSVSGRYYGVISMNGQLYVNIPWEDTYATKGSQYTINVDSDNTLIINENY